MKKILCLYLVLFVLLINAPVALGAGKLTINSSPKGAKIYARDPSKTGKIFVGKTPFVITVDELIDNYVKTTSFAIIVEKEGFEPYRTLFSKTGHHDIDLNVSLEISRNIVMIKKTDRLVSSLFEAQRLVRSKDYKSALKALDELEKEFPQYSSVYEMKAGTLYLKKQFREALAYYRKAFSTNPDNLDAYKMKVYLEDYFKKGGKK